MKTHGVERIALVSDSTCDTAEALTRAILARFDKAEVAIRRFPKVRTESQLEEIFKSLESPFLIVYSFATEALLERVREIILEKRLMGYDLISSATEVFSEFFHTDPSKKQGSLRSTESLSYFDRMEAIEFTVKHDDGLRQSDVAQAEIILTGVSRTSKTPTSMYLAHKGYRVANIPLVYGVDEPSVLKTAHERGVFIVSLTIEANFLARIRRTRFQKLGTAANHADTYVDLKVIADELEYASKLAKKYRWPVIDVTNKAIEETSSEILLLLQKKQGRI